MSDQSPESKNGLLTLIQILWLPVTGFTGAVTLVYNFYQSWRGDQAVITYIFGGLGLLVLMIALAWVGFKPSTTVELPFLSSKDEPLTKDIPAYPPFFQRAARIMLALVFLAGLIGVGVLFQRRQALQNKLVVLITTFEGPEEVYGLRNEIIENLNADFPDDAEVEIIKISDVITPDQGSPVARALGERYLADVVLWGWYRPTQNPNITIHIENLSPDQELPLETSGTWQPTVTLADLESFSFQQQSGQETSALISSLAGYLQFKSENYEQALMRFNDSVSKIQGNTILLKNQAAIYFYRANTRFFLGEYQQAIKDYSKVIQLDPKAATAYHNRGNAYHYLQQNVYAIADYSKAIQLAPQFAEAYYARGIAYHYLQQNMHAIADYSKAIQIDPQNAKAYHNRGNAYASQQQYTHAIADYSKAIQIDPQLAEPYYARGAVYAAQQQYTKTIADCSKAIQIDPQNAKAYYTRGIAYHYLQQYAQAIADYSKAIQLDPQDAKAYQNRGIDYYVQQQYEQAIADFSEVIQIDPRGAAGYYARGLAYQSISKTTEAEADFAKYKELTGQEHP